MAFAQLTYRESLRDIEVCLAAQAAKLYHMGFREPVSALDAGRCQRVARLAHLCRLRAAPDRSGQTSSTPATAWAWNLRTPSMRSTRRPSTCACRSFRGRSFARPRRAVKLHTLLDLRGTIPSFIHISDGKVHDVHVLDLSWCRSPGAFYVMDRGYLDFERLHVLHQAGAFFVTRAKSNLDARRVYSAKTDRTTGIICDQTIALDGYYSQRDLPGAPASHPFQGSRDRQDAGLPHQPLHPAGR